MRKSSVAEQTLARRIARILFYAGGTIDWVLVFVVGYLSRIIAGILFWVLVASYGIQVRGYRKALGAVRNGRLVIVANHPTLLEPVLIYSMFLPWNLIPRIAVWSMPDSRIIPSWAHWFFKPWRCISFSRQQKQEKGMAQKKALEVLVRHGIVAVHPEGGRTYKGSEFIYSADGERCIRRIETNTHRLICDAHATVLPLWIEYKSGKWPFAFVHFGEAFGWQELPSDNGESRKKIEEKILNAGK